MESEAVAWRVPPILAGSVAAATGYRSVGAAHQLHRGLPSACLTVILTFGTPLRMLAHPMPDQPAGSFDQLVGGLHDTPALIDMAGWSEGIQLSLTPLGSRTLLGLPAGELARRDVQGWALFGDRAAAQLSERLAAAGSWPLRFAALEAFLIPRLRPAALPAEVVEAFRVLRHDSSVPVSAVARHVGYSPRRLGQLFATEIGLSPKTVARVSRFHAARRTLIARAGADQPLDLADIALTAGYFDQAHLAREWVSIAGLSPTAWLAEDFRSVQAAELLPAAG